MKKIILSLLFSTYFLLAFSQQNVTFEKKNFPGKEEELKNIIKELEKGDHLYNRGERFFKPALEHYKKAYEFNPNNASLNFKIGECILNTIHRAESAKYFDAAYKLDPNVDPNIIIDLAEAHHLNEDWDLAIDWYKAYEEHIRSSKKISPDLKEREIKVAEKRIAECKNGKVLSANPIKVKIKNLGDSINTEYSELCPIITADETVMYFTSKRPGTTGFSKNEAKKDHMIPEYFEDIYVSYRQKDGSWSKAKNVGLPLNTTGQDGTVYLSPDGHRMLVYNSDDDGSLFDTHLEGTKWTEPVKLPHSINSRFHESDASLSLDQKTIYFVSNKTDDNLGKVDPRDIKGEYTHDIFYAKWNDSLKTWGPAKNIGFEINTEYNERAVFLHPDGKTLYFASEGHNSMGGYDIFKSVFENNKWQKPVNLGYPLNTADNDIFFVLNAEGSRGYFTSRHSVDGIGDNDIFEVTFLKDEAKPAVVKKTTILKGSIVDADTKKPIPAVIKIVDNETHEEVYSAKTNSQTGNYLVSLPSGKNYGISIHAEDYLYHSENITLADSAGFNEMSKSIELKKLDAGKTIVLENIFFHTNEATLTRESHPELDHIQQVLIQNPNLKVEISGHTDDVGADKYNQALSEKRAKAVVDYLIAKGIDKKRLEPKGYGKSKPIAPNTTEEGREKNRRTEFTIISK